MLTLNRTAPFLLVIAITLAVASLSGCEQITGTRLVEINGEITMDHKPLNDVFVAFVPLQYRNNRGKIKKIGFGQSDDAGRFTIRIKQSKGIEPGEYRVLIYSVKDTKANPDARRLYPQNELLPDFLKEAGITASSEEMDGLGADESASDTGIPSAYNFQSELRFTVGARAGILYPKFQLESHRRQ